LEGNKVNVNVFILLLCDVYILQISSYVCKGECVLCKHLYAELILEQLRKNLLNGSPLTVTQKVGDALIRGLLERWLGPTVCASKV